ncbi:hypothetical protein BURK2_03233 [Burkholderiales bacterium]|nr:hypothetical protein BURK2_03233 [Burkholderiales bacterium]
MTQHLAHSPGRSAWLLITVFLVLLGCATPETSAPRPSGTAPAAAPSAPAASAAPPIAPTSAAAPAAAPPALPPLLPYDEAVTRAFTELLARAPFREPERVAVVVDPLIDGVSRAQTRSTADIETRLAAQLKAKHPNVELRPFTAAALGDAPYLVIGTFTPINQQGKPEGERESFRFCLAMIDLKSNKLVSKTAVRAQLGKVDATPLPYFQEAPIWAREAAGEGYVKSCQATKPGEAADAGYVGALVQAASLNEGIRAYNTGKYRDALALFERVAASAQGAETRARVGIYLCQLRLNQRDAAARAFGQLVDQGLADRRVAVLFQFRPGTAALMNQRYLPQDLWMKLLAQRLASGAFCGEVAGHASRDGHAAVNERLSTLRAEHVRSRLVADAPVLDKRFIAAGYGSREAKIGTAKGDASDALDRRVELRLFACQ